MSEENKQEQTLSAVLQRLQAIGVKQIKEDTHLDIKKIEDILEKRFDRLDYVRAKGFINIIEKEYKVNLSAWLEEYCIACPQEKDLSPQKEEQKVEINTLLSNPAAMKKLGIIAGIVILCVVVILWKMSGKSTNQANPNNQNKELITPQIPQESEQVTPQSLESQEESNLAVPTTLESQEVQEVQEVPQKIEDNQPKAEVVEDKEPSEYGESVFSEIEFDPENVLLLETKSKLWLGYINLDTKKRNANTKTEFEIPLDGTILINVARGRFTLKLNGEEMYFPGYKSVYFVYTKEGGLKRVSKEEFMHLNGGREW